MQVIDISSSPEPMAARASTQPGPARKRPRRAPLAREPSVVEVIELTDSDGEPPARRSKTCHPPGPPTSAPGLASTSGAPGPAPGASRHRDGTPLFFPGDQDLSRPLLVPESWNAPAAVPPQASPPLEPIDQYMVSVLEIVPDVQPTHALTLIEQVMQSDPANVVQLVLHALFEDPAYPKLDKKGKHKRDEAEDGPSERNSSRVKVDYGDRLREWGGSPDDHKRYLEHSLEQLVIDFPRIPKPHIRSRLHDCRFYAPTYLLLARELKQAPLPFKLKLTNTVVSKGKTRQDPGFDKEREWVLLKVAESATEQDAAVAASMNEQEYEDTGESIECGCCFSGYPFDQMIQCPEAHLFCKSCMTAYSSNKLGEHNPNIVCMDQSGCKLPFPESELARFLSSKLLELYYRVKQRKEIEEAGLENLEECPLCEYKCVIDNEMEKLFRCENVACGAVTCRACKKADHLPRTCKEVEDDKHLDAQHVIEEAMTQALMRNCPKCQKSFIKEMGCNKMTCPSCHTVSCYICRKVINGYDHFANSSQHTKAAKGISSKCNLWDPIERRHDEEVSEAAKRALEELRQSRPDVDQSNIKVDLPTPRAPPLPPPPPLQPIPPQFRPVAAPNLQAGIGFNGFAGMQPPRGMMAPQWGAAVPAAGGGGGARVDILRAAILARARDMNIPVGHVGAGDGAGGMGMGAPVQAAPARNDPFLFGAGQAHNFVPPAPAVDPRFQQWLNNRRQAGAGEVHMVQIPLPVAAGVPFGVPGPEPALPLALARARRAHTHVPPMLHQPQLQVQAGVPVPMQAQPPRVPVQPQVQPVITSGVGGRPRRNQ